MKSQNSEGELKVLTWSQIDAAAERAESRIRERRQRGRWHLCIETLELVYEEHPGRPKYFIDLERMCTSAAMLDWLFQLAKKTWMTPQDVGDLVQALQDIFDPQARLCSLACTSGRGAGRTLEATAYLRRRYVGDE